MAAPHHPRPEHSQHVQHVQHVQQHPRTTPVLPQRYLLDFPPLSEQTEMHIRERCWRCQTAGYIGRPVPRCGECGAIWEEEVLAAHRRHNWRGTLPCAHNVRVQRMQRVPQVCPTCDGTGHLERWVTLDEWLTFVSSLYEGAEEQAETSDASSTLAEDLPTQRHQTF